MRLKVLLICFLLFITIGSLALLNMDKSYSYGLSFNIVGKEGSRKLIYYDADSGVEISIDTAITYYQATEYMEFILSSGDIYFYRGNEITYAEYIKGSASEQADIRARKYGNAGYRVKSTSEFKKALDAIYKNHKIGVFYISFSPYDNIDFNAVNSYYMENYGLLSPYQNYYTYQVKGEWEPNRFESGILNIKDTGEYIINTSNIRITGNELSIVKNFINKLLPLMQGDGSDYQKILAAYTYINKTTSYLTDDGFTNDFLATNTSIYDVFINRKSVCIGYSIAFSYLMNLFGIESYIVDDLTSVNVSSQTFTSVHTYNIVKLDNKFYKIDLTGNVFLGGLSSKELYNSKLKISTTKYNTSGKPTTYNFDYTKINSYLSASKNMKTTTTRKVNTTTTTGKTTKITGSRTTNKNIITTTTTKYTNITTTNNNKSNNNSNNNIYTTTNYYENNTSSSSINNETTTTNNSGYIGGESSNNENHSTTINNNNNTNNNTTTNNSNNNTSNHNNDKQNTNNITIYLLIVAGIVIILYIIYAIMKKNKKNKYDDDITDILNRHIR